MNNTVEAIPFLQKNKKIVLVDIKTMQPISDVVYDEYYDFDSFGSIFVVEGYILKINEKWGLVSKSGDTLIPFIYDKIFKEKDNYFIVVKNDKFGMLNSTGDEIIPIQYDYLNKNNYNSITVTIGEKKGIININNQEIIPAVYDDIFQLNSDLFCIYKNEKCGLIDLRGNTLIEANKYDSIGIVNGLLSAEINGWGFYINLEGKEYINADFDFSKPKHDFDNESIF